MPNRRRRATPTREAGRRRAAYLALRLGRALKESRLGLGTTQAEAASRAGVSQAFWSRLERGLTTAVSLETVAAASAAVDVQLAAFVEARPGADLPRDVEHLRRQELVVITASRGGWRARPERPIDPLAARSRSIDVLLERSRPSKRAATVVGREVAVVEIEDLLTDIGDVFRGLADKVTALQREQQQVKPHEETPRVAGLLIVRATKRNRELIGRFGGLFRTRFPAPSADWLRALGEADHEMPEQDGLAWSSVRGDRLFAAHHITQPPGGPAARPATSPPAAPAARPADAAQ